MKEAIKFWFSRQIVDLGFFITIVVGIIVLCAIFIGGFAAVSAIRKRSKKKQQEYWERKK